MKTQLEKPNELTAEAMSHIQQLLARDNEGLEQRCRRHRCHLAAVRSMTLLCMMVGCYFAASPVAAAPRCSKVVCGVRVDADQVCDRIENTLLAL